MSRSLIKFSVTALVAFCQPTDVLASSDNYQIANQPNSLQSYTDTTMADEGKLDQVQSQARPAQPKTDPSSWASMDEFFKTARNVQERGLVRYRVMVGVSGRVLSCEITQSSGSIWLDDWTCRRVSQRSRFIPATNAQGDRVTGKYEGSVLWVLPDRPPPQPQKPSAHALSYSYVVEVDGLISSCEVLTAKGAILEHADTAQPCNMLATSEIFRDETGKPVRKRVTIVRETRIESLP